MLTHLYNCLVAVTDYDRALAFYTDTLGWEKRDDMPMGEERWLTVAIPGTQTALALGRGDMAGALTPGGNTGITVVTDDIDGDVERMTAAGVQFTGPIETMPWGDRAAFFQDPDGNVFFLIHGSAPA
ncbi:MAG TPA: VOC family protein [Thermomicrobiales bacterium]|jgi:predicted enzyme related to lactoylglutathione lyase|nr:VOC family protein [Thermomicrobiales bacterium]